MDGNGSHFGIVELNSNPMSNVPKPILYMKWVYDVTIPNLPHDKYELGIILEIFYLNL